MTDATFDDLPLTERARETAHALGWRDPTPIQRLVIPQLAMGRDVIGRAETGSGKTGAFGLVLTDAVKQPGLKALVLAPTRELVLQIASDLNRMAAGAPFRAAAVYGGVPYDEQIAALRDPETTCVVATTGRLLDLIHRKQVNLTQVSWVVLDEADRMLDMGFLPEVEKILGWIPGTRQTALFTATMPKKIAQLAHRYMAHPREVEVGPATPETAQHFRVDVNSQVKFDALVALVEAESPGCALVFTRTREGADQVARLLRERDERALPFHGDLDQAARERVVAELKAGRASLVVATDVAARGLDFHDITHVINYDVPEEADGYVHRAGRTARAGRAGRVFTLVTENDGHHVAAAEKAAGLKLQSYRLAVMDDGVEVELTRATPAPAKPVTRGGNALGARRRKQATRPNPIGKLLRESKDVEEGREYDLPPSRRRRSADDE